VFQTIDGITIPPKEISITTSKPMMLMRMSNKSIAGEVQMTSSDSRIRRLIPYMSYYYPQHEYNNYPLEYLPMVGKHFLTDNLTKFLIFHSIK
jgi:hypothetical protein